MTIKKEPGKILFENSNVCHNILELIFSANFNLFSPNWKLESLWQNQKKKILLTNVEMTIEMIGRFKPIYSSLKGLALHD